MGGPRPHDRTLIFLHIGKTAGTTLGRILRRHYPRDQIYSIPVPPNARELDLCDGSGGPGVRRLHPPREMTLITFADLPEDLRRRYRLVLGHTVFGIHELLPQPSCYLTMLRNPVSLVQSLYGYILRTPSHFHHSAVAGRGMSLAEFVESGISIETDNSQVRALSGDLHAPVGACPPELLDRAVANIERRFPVVGITERFDESLIALRENFGLTHLQYVRAKTAPRGQRRERLDPGVVRLIEQRNALDLQLYRRALGRLDALAANPRHQAELARFRRANALYRPIGTVGYTLPKAIMGRLQLARR